MRETLALLGLLLLAICATGQTANSTAQSAPTTLMGPPVLATPATPLPPPIGGLIVQSGYATTAGWGYPPLVTTPTANLSIVSANPVGATNATSNLQVGASNSTVESASVAVSAVQTAIEISQPGAVALTESASPQTTSRPGSSTVANAGLGAAQFDVVNARAPGETRSMGEVVREMRQHSKPVPARTFTNTDVQNLKDREQPASQNPQ